MPWAAVYWLVHVLHGSPGLAEQVWYTTLFAGAAAGCYLLLRALRVGPAGSTLGALAYVFNGHVAVIGINPVYLAAMVLLPGFPAVVLITASGRWPLRNGVLLFGSSAPFLGYADLNPPLDLMIARFSPRRRCSWGGSTDGQPHAGRHAPSRSAPCSRGRLLVLARTERVPAPDRRHLHLASQSGWTWTEGRATLANGFWLNNDWGWNYAAYYPFRL